MKKLKIVAATLIIIMAAIILLWKLPFYFMLHRVELPEGYKTIETNVILTDIYTVHILGEKVIKWNGTYEELEGYIEENNSSRKLKEYFYVSIFRDWDDFAVYPGDYESEIPKDERKNYYVITYYLDIQN